MGSPGSPNPSGRTGHLRSHGRPGGVVPTTGLQYWTRGTWTGAGFRGLGILTPFFIAKPCISMDHSIIL